MKSAVPVITPEPRGDGWFVPSASLPDYGYMVRQRGEMWICGCPGYVYRKGQLPGEGCRHVKAVKAFLAQKEVTYRG